jgi:hypothetical protein
MLPNYFKSLNPFHKTVLTAIHLGLFVVFFLIGIKEYYQLIFSVRIFILHGFLLSLLTHLFCKIKYFQNNNYVVSSTMIIIFSYAIIYFQLNIFWVEIIEKHHLIFIKRYFLK